MITEISHTTNWRGSRISSRRSGSCTASSTSCCTARRGIWQIVQSVPGLAGNRRRSLLTAVGAVRDCSGDVGAVGVGAGLVPHVQTAVLLSMNVVELTFARPLLLWPAGLIPINLLFLSLAWVGRTRESATACSQGFAVIRSR